VGLLSKRDVDLPGGVTLTDVDAIAGVAVVLFLIGVLVPGVPVDTQRLLNWLAVGLIAVWVVLRIYLAVRKQPPVRQS
jgi:hypothetical protein